MLEREDGEIQVPSWVADAEPEQLANSMQAFCYAVNRSVDSEEVAAALGVEKKQVAAIADSLATMLQGSALMLQRHEDTYQLVTRPEVAWVVERALHPERVSRLSRAALETLAIVAYRQPLTRISIEEIRGVNCEAVLDNLERRGLLTEVGRQDAPGHPRLFGTTLRFLQAAGLESIDHLPPLSTDVPGANLADALHLDEEVDGAEQLSEQPQSV